MMVGRDKLKRLAQGYLKFLITRDATEIKHYLSLDFERRLHATQQLKLIQKLPSTLNYGITPEVHLWKDYLLQTENGTLNLSPFQFDVSFRNINNPLLSETMTVTIHSLAWEDEEWRILSVLCDDDHHLLVNYASQDTSTRESEAPRQIQPKP